MRFDGRTHPGQHNYWQGYNFFTEFDNTIAILRGIPRGIECYKMGERNSTKLKK